MRFLWPTFLALFCVFGCSTKVTGSGGGQDATGGVVGDGDDVRGSGGEGADGLGGAGASSTTGGTGDSGPDPACEPGTERSVECGLCGGAVETCEDGHWISAQGCEDEGVCARGSQEQGAICGACGVEERTCLANCQWGEWFCTDEGECQEGTVEEEGEGCDSCGLSRERSRTCEANCTWSAWGQWSACEAAACTLGEVETEEVSCGRCGTAKRSRTCDGCGYPPFGPFGECQGEGPCAQGEVEYDTVPCGWCGYRERTRTCGTNCQWGSWVESPSCLEQGQCDPNSESQQISRGCGNCNTGTQTATRTCSSSCEYQYGPWSACMAVSGCTPGATKANTVASCGAGTVWLEHTCSGECAWVPGEHCCSTNGDCNCDSNGCD